ncbi:MAG TPA: ATP-binding protein [Terriglobales bacterium]|nr:ATP-binding protein [Terriglobales bacterium]
MHRRLFWKIFLSFWITQIIFISYLGYKAHILSKNPGPLWLATAEKTMPLVAQEVLERYEIGGQTALRAEMDQQSVPDRLQFWFYDSRGNELSGCAQTPEVSKWLPHLGPASGVQQYHEDDFSLLSTEVPGTNGPYRLVAEYHLQYLLRGPGLLRLVYISAGMSCVTCLLLALYLTRPIIGLRRATHALAEGDLNARAGAKLGGRKDEIADLVRDFDRMAERIRDLVYSQRRLLGNVSHELRSPLARMRVALALARRAEEPSQSGPLDRMESEIARLDSMIGRILTLARLESGELHPKMEEFSLNQLISKIVADAEYEAARAGHAIEYRADREIFVRGNKDLLASAIENVVRNAVYYTRGSQPISVSLTEDIDHAILSVRDHGPGVPPASLPLLFRPFYRVDDSRVSSTGGTGLGLAIAERAVSLHGGSISATNQESGGLSVQIRIPRAVTKAAPKSAVAEKVTTAN